MKFNALLSAAALGAAAIAAQPANAALGAQVIAPVTGKSYAVFISSDARSQDNLYEVSSASFLFNNQTGVVGDDVFVKNVIAGDIVEFELKVFNHAGNVYKYSVFTGPAASNPDNVFHADVTSTGPLTYHVGFEDQLFGTKDYDGDFNDLEFDVKFVAVPEPATWAMMIGGFGLVGAAARRRKTKTAVTYA